MMLLYSRIDVDAVHSYLALVLNKVDLFLFSDDIKYTSAFPSVSRVFFLVLFQKMTSFYKQQG